MSCVYFSDVSTINDVKIWPSKVLDSSFCHFVLCLVLVFVFVLFSAEKRILIVLCKKFQVLVPSPDRIYRNDCEFREKHYVYNKKNIEWCELYFLWNWNLKNTLGAVFKIKFTSLHKASNFRLSAHLLFTDK